MITKLMCYRSTSTNPYVNLASEEFLLSKLALGECILFLWQNEKTVVIGRNQDPHNECCIRQLEADGGAIVRRLSGGGAVYHDLGNLNFSFLVQKTDYCVDRQLRVIETALDDFGIHVTRDGRNDLLVGTRKCSGNAFYEKDGRCCHHGTLMVSVDLDAMTHYLTVPDYKLTAKAVASVQARVINLSLVCSELTVASLEEKLRAAAEQVYGLGMKELVMNDAPQWLKLILKYKSAEWNGRKLQAYTETSTMHFTWGSVTIRADIIQKKIRTLEIITDALELIDGEKANRRWIGCEYDRERIFFWIREERWKNPNTMMLQSSEAVREDTRQP